MTSTFLLLRRVILSKAKDNVNASNTIHVQWIRSGIGFTRRQKTMVRSLGLRRLNQVVELPDTPSIRGLVASIPHLVHIVSAKSQPAWVSVPEYTITAAVESAPSAVPETENAAPSAPETEETPAAEAAEPSSAAVKTKRARKPKAASEESEGPASGTRKRPGGASAKKKESAAEEKV